MPAFFSTWFDNWDLVGLGFSCVQNTPPNCPRAKCSRNYVTRQQYDATVEQLNFLHNELKIKQQDIVFIEKSLTTKERDLLYLEVKLTEWKADYEQLQQRARLEFEQVANRLLEEKSKKFSDQNEKQLNDLLHPLRERIREFGQDVERRFTDEAKDKVSLKKEIEQLIGLNQQLSHDAKNLATALKGDSKIQGDWGEMQLEMLLEKAGLVRGTHFEAQSSFKDVNGQEKRPDFVIHLPDEKHLIVDSKVSLKAYEKFYNADNEELRSRHLKEHVDSLRSHLRDLSSKNYPQLQQLNSPISCSFQLNLLFPWHFSTITACFWMLWKRTWSLSPPLPYSPPCARFPISGGKNGRSGMCWK